MKTSISRRDFLKLSGLLPLGLASPWLASTLSRLQASPGNGQNILLVVFDALSARNVSFLGYERNTMPKLHRLAKRAVVYHNHFAAGNFTSSGTASLLTGVYPWTHRAIQFRSRLSPRLNRRTFFTAFGDNYRFAYTHNPWAYIVLRPLGPQIDDLVPVEQLYLADTTGFIKNLLSNDQDIGEVAWTRGTSLEVDGSAYSLLLSHPITAMEDAASPPGLRARFPRGLPGYGATSTFVIERAVDWLGDKLASTPQPFFGYFHLLPPHAPYRTRNDFVDRFKDDGYEPPQKPLDLFSLGEVPDEALRRRSYDEYLLYVDAEFSRLYARLESMGLLENTWLVFTSDHGEIFERGLKEHGTPTLYQPEIRVPLVIFEPGRSLGTEIHVPTSAVDVLPTLEHLSGRKVSSWTEGVVLPPYGDARTNDDLGVYTLMAAHNDPTRPIHVATAMIVKGGYKLHYYTGYDELGGADLVKLFDLEADPEELSDVASLHRETAAEFLGELKGKIADADEAFR